MQGTESWRRRTSACHQNVGHGRARLSGGRAQAVFACLLLLFAGAAAQGRTPLEARKELANIGVDFERSVFIQRARESDAVAVELFLEAGMNPTVVDEQGRTAMVWAAIEDHVRILELFAAAGVDLEGAARDPERRTLLHWAARENSLGAARFLIEAGVALGARDEYGDNALHHAVKRNYEAMVELLLSAGAEVDAPDRNGLVPIVWATLRGWAEGFELLRRAGADLKVRVGTAGTITDAQTGGWYVVETGSSLLSLAASRGHADIVKKLLDAGVPPDGADGVAALTRAASGGHSEVVALLLEAQAPVNGRDALDRTALFYASQNGDAEIVRTLLAAGANEQMDLALMNAAGAGHGSIAKMLLEAGAGSEVALNDWRKLVHAARERGHTDVIEALKGPRTELVRDDRKLTTRDIRHFQGCLQAFGYDPGGMDGILAETTVEALRQFQAHAGLPESGLLNEETRAALIERGCPRIVAVERPG